MAGNVVIKDGPGNFHFQTMIFSWSKLQLLKYFAGIPFSMTPSHLYLYIYSTLILHKSYVRSRIFKKKLVKIQLITTLKLKSHIYMLSISKNNIYLYDTKLSPISCFSGAVVFDNQLINNTHISVSSSFLIFSSFLSNNIASSLHRVQNTSE